MKDFINYIKRYKILFLIELLVTVAVTVFLVKKNYFYLIPPNWREMGINGVSLTYGYMLWSAANIVSKCLLFATTPVVTVFTIIRYIIYDNKNQKVLNNSFPIRNEKNTRHELLIGGIPITISVVLNGLIGNCFAGFAFIHDDTIKWSPNFKITELWVICITLALCLGAYAFLVFARKVSSSIGGMILIYVTGAFLGVCIFGFYIDSNLNIFVGNEILFELILALCCSFHLVLSIIGLIISDKKLDIAKGGSYYFRPVQIAVCIMSGASFLTWMLGWFDSEKGGLTPLYTIFSVILSLLVTVCVYFLTGAKKISNKTKANMERA